MIWIIILISILVLSIILFVVDISETVSATTFFSGFVSLITLIGCVIGIAINKSNSAIAKNEYYELKAKKDTIQYHIDNEIYTLSMVVYENTSSGTNQSFKVINFIEEANQHNYKIQSYVNSSESAWKNWFVNQYVIDRVDTLWVINLPE